MAHMFNSTSFIIHYHSLQNDNDLDRNPVFLLKTRVCTCVCACARVSMSFMFTEQRIGKQTNKQTTNTHEKRNLSKFFVNKFLTQCLPDTLVTLGAQYQRTGMGLISTKPEGDYRTQYKVFSFLNHISYLCRF